MNLGMEGATSFDPGAEISLLKASTAEEGGEGGVSPPPGATMGAAYNLDCQKNPTTAASRDQRVDQVNLESLIKSAPTTNY